MTKQELQQAYCQSLETKSMQLKCEIDFLERENFGEEFAQAFIFLLTLLAVFGMCMILAWVYKRLFGC